MKIVHVVALLLLATPSAAIAESGRHSAIPNKYRSATAQQPADTSTGVKTPNIVHNPGECLPDVGEPVWGSGNALLGFSCHAPN
jgi:hypothetical protein